MDSMSRLLDEATHRQVVGEMGDRSFVEDTAAAVRHLAFAVRSGKRFSAGDAVAILEDANLSTDGIAGALTDLTRKGILVSYPKDGTLAYYMQRGARIEYGESIGRKSRVSSWYFAGAEYADSGSGGAREH